MHHVFVETNFLVEVIRPFPGPDAEALLARANKDVQLYLPWVAIKEAKRTLVEIVSRDLGFTDALGKFAAKEYRAGTLLAPDKKIVEALAKRAKGTKANAILAINSTVDAVAAQTTVIEPDKAVVTKVMDVVTAKRLAGFDEMVLGAVLTKAEALHKAGEQSLWFCNLNKNDFDPDKLPSLACEYDNCGLQYRASFDISGAPMSDIVETFTVIHPIDVDGHGPIHDLPPNGWQAELPASSKAGYGSIVMTKTTTKEKLVVPLSNVAYFKLRK